MTYAAGSASLPSPATLMQTPHPQRTHNLCGPVRRMTCSATVSVLALCDAAVSTCLKVACLTEGSASHPVPDHPATDHLTG